MISDQTIKQRLIGAIVLVAIAVIFLPGILGQKKQQAKFESQIPPQPATTQPKGSPKEQGLITLTQEAQQTNNVTLKSQPPGESEDALHSSAEDSTGVDRSVTEPSSTSTIGDSEQKKASQNSSQADSNTERVTPKTMPNSNTKSIELKSKSIVGEMQPAYIIQVGAFSSKENADALSLKLEQASFKSFVRPFFRDQQSTLYRVYAGPWLSREEADAQIKTVGEITKLRPLVIVWEPERH